MKRINWRYAIGELLIITIGISIAFLLNNWAASANEKRLANEYLSNLKSDLHQDITLLDSNIAQLDERLGYFQALFPHLRAKLPGRDSMAMRVFKYIDPVVFYPRRTTWQSLESSGDLKLIKDMDLKNRIIEHYQTYKRVEMENERHASFAEAYLAPYFMKEVNFSTLRAEDFPYLNDSYFRNLTYSLYGIYQLEAKAQKSARDSAQKLYDQL